VIVKKFKQFAKDVAEVVIQSRTMRYGRVEFKLW
jgi:hypothetical protein